MGEGATSDQHYWVAMMEMANYAADHIVTTVDTVDIEDAYHKKKMATKRNKRGKPQLVRCQDDKGQIYIDELVALFNNRIDLVKLIPTDKVKEWTTVPLCMICVCAVPDGEK